MLIFYFESPIMINSTLEKDPLILLVSPSLRIYLRLKLWAQSMNKALKIEFEIIFHGGPSILWPIDPMRQSYVFFLLNSGRRPNKTF